MAYELVDGTTIENAQEWGAIYINLYAGGASMFRLPPGTIRRLGYIPQPEIARIMFCADTGKIA